MEFQVRLSARALRDLDAIYAGIQAYSSAQARSWFEALSDRILSLNRHPERGAHTPERKRLRHLLFGKKPDVYRIIYAIDQSRLLVDVLHIRHAARSKFRSREIR